jgi:site-specific recombinase XerD
VITTAAGTPVSERNLRRALDEAKAAAKLDTTEERLSWHSLRHSWASLPATVKGAIIRVTPQAAAR